MPIKDHNKLVRDKIPENLKAKGVGFQSKVLNTEEFKEALLNKLLEEILELINAQGDRTKMVEELADVLEVRNSIVKHFDLRSNKTRRKLNTKESTAELLNKLLATAQEFISIKRDKEGLIKKIIHISELIDSIIESSDLDRDEIEIERAEKIISKGAFNYRIYLESTDEQTSSTQWTLTYLVFTK